jgi:membrane-associated phospholipid phosphatase
MQAQSAAGVASTSSTVHGTRTERIVAGVSAVAIAAALDRPMRTALRDRGHDGSTLRALSATGNALGTASHLVPAMAGAYAITLLTGSRDASDRVIAIAAGYAAADLTAGVLKEGVGRERPFVHGDPARFHPFTSHGDDHSFPSGHVTHIVALATGAAMESHRAWVRDAGIGASVLVGWQRVHADQHWTSDVVAAALLSNVVSGAATRAVEHALLHR